MRAMRIILDGLRPLGVTQIALDGAGVLAPLGSLPDDEIAEGIGVLRDDLLVPLGDGGRHPRRTIRTARHPSAAASRRLAGPGDDRGARRTGAGDTPAAWRARGAGHRAGGRRDPADTTQDASPARGGDGRGRGSGPRRPGFSSAASAPARRSTRSDRGLAGDAAARARPRPPARGDDRARAGATRAAALPGGT